MILWNKQEFSMNFYNKQEYFMNLCNFQQFLKLSRLKYEFSWINKVKIFQLTCGRMMLVMACSRRRGSRWLQKYQTNEIVY
jgi:hypothetical protein